ncbi:hypothetical protein [Amphibiibacter pelophylacis]|uniref:Uncharacterized protein n=1 Tax=Amphibiibacter pelophylacis TaxID=1799477 RepID=A0ACC6P299_9BURK
MFALGVPEGTRLHLCVYHARFPLLQRSAIEHQLDAVFNRRDPQAVFSHATIRSVLDGPGPADHLFVVLASPVCEVGRDWDASWAVAEPSSMRSLIQLAGRVQRHRGAEPQSPNVLVFDTNLKNFRQTGVPGKERKAIFIRPGFEADVPLHDPRCRFRLEANRLGALLRPHEYEVLTAVPRIQPQPPELSQMRRRLVDLEQARMVDALQPKTDRALDVSGLNAATGWQFPAAALNGVLQRCQPFRAQTERTQTLVFLPDDETDPERLVLHRVEEGLQYQRGRNPYVCVADSLLHPVDLVLAPGMSYWGPQDLLDLLQEQAEAQDMGLRRCAEKFTPVEVRDHDQGWAYHPWLGFQPLA